MVDIFFFLCVPPLKNDIISPKCGNSQTDTHANEPELVSMINYFGTVFFFCISASVF